MKLIPYVLSQRSLEHQKIDVYKIVVFLDKAGKSLWEAVAVASPEEINSEYLEPNGIFAQNIHIDEQMEVAWISVDAKRTKLSDFYNWEEASVHPEKPECWRDFYFFMNVQKEELWSPGFLQTPDAEIQGFGNIQGLFDKIKNLEMRV